MFTITITITQDENNNVTVKTNPQVKTEPKKKVGQPKKTTAKPKKTVTKKFQQLPEPVDMNTDDDDDGIVPFETL